MSTKTYGRSSSRRKSRSSRRRGGGAQLDEHGGFAPEQSDNICSRICTDICGTCTCKPSFRALDGQREIDIPASFSPGGGYWYIYAGKLIASGTAWFTIFWGFGRDPRAFWLAYLTHWALIFATLYLLMSFLNTLIPVSQPPAGQTIVDCRTKFTWILFTIGCNLQVVVTVAFWTMIYDGNMSLYSILSHGVVALMVIIDGLVLNAIPVRLRHWIEFVFPIGFLYLVWTYIHSELGIGNPDYEDEDPVTNDDLIYSVIDWQNDLEQSLIISALIIGVLSPLTQIAMTIFSGLRRRYVHEPSAFSPHYYEMGSPHV